MGFRVQVHQISPEPNLNQTSVTLLRMRIWQNLEVIVLQNSKKTVKGGRRYFLLL